MAGIWRWIVGFVGLLLLAAGVWQTAWVPDGGGGVVAVVAAGALLAVSPLVVDRVTGLAIGLEGVSVGLVSDIEHIAPQSAGILRQTELVGLAESYALVYEELRGAEHYAARVALQDLLVKHAASLALRRKFDPAEVRRLFAEGAPAVRVLALGLMKGDSALADVDTIRAAITESRTGNEQYQGLRLAESQWRGLSASDKSLILASIDAARIEAGSDRASIADRLRSRSSA
ncbi:hypothetical protein O7608_13035 [Solwaraspora sp. WMMA2056]|uniref:hypothetical protein n=1 Tax=Solwaraspora sp. WMMA2056 TaxID=3015161 RepID=UPI00259BEA65|nr:hypothetical protein [Solwaraspora sp. WMMA2056]WJK43237.1 hypothetical protein O7608_13035 [Solwaraspora sp. WMMA2056]